MPPESEQAVARAELPSGAWVEYRDKLKAGDKFATTDALAFKSNEQREVSYTASLEDRARNALLARVITAWSYETESGWPIPEKNAAGEGILAELDIDDYNALAEAVEPLMAKVGRSPKRPQQKSAAS